MTHTPRHRQSGFTLFELITVIVIMGIIGALITPRFFERLSYDAKEFQDQAQFILRYGQKLAIGQNRPVYVRLNGSSVALCFDSACTNQVPAPSGSNSNTANTLAACGNSSSWYCEGLANNITYSLLPVTETLFYFDAMGKPFLSSDTPPTNTSSFTQLRVRVTGDGTNRDFFVEQETGYVHF